MLVLLVSLLTGLQKVHRLILLLILVSLHIERFGGEFALDLHLVSGLGSGRPRLNGQRHRVPIRAQMLVLGDCLGDFAFVGLPLFLESA